MGGGERQPDRGAAAKQVLGVGRRRIVAETRSVAAGARSAPAPSPTSKAIMNLFVFRRCSASLTARGL
jgi:hypothetical protein